MRNLIGVTAQNTEQGWHTLDFREFSLILAGWGWVEIAINSGFFSYRHRPPFSSATFRPNKKILSFPVRRPTHVKKLRPQKFYQTFGPKERQWSILSFFPSDFYVRPTFFPPTTGNKPIFIFIFFPPTMGKTPCRSSSSVEYNFRGLSFIQ